MPVSDFRVVGENYIPGKEYPIWKCDNECINATILGSVDDGCDLEEVVRLINIENSQSGLTIVRDAFGKRYYALVNLNHGTGLFEHDVCGVLKGYLQESCDEEMLKIINKYGKVSNVYSRQNRDCFKTYLFDIQSYAKSKKLQEFIDYVIEFQSGGSPYLMFYLKNKKPYFILVSVNNLDYEINCV